MYFIWHHADWPALDAVAIEPMVHRPLSRADLDSYLHRREASPVERHDLRVLVLGEPDRRRRRGATGSLDMLRSRTTTEIANLPRLCS